MWATTSHQLRRLCTFPKTNLVEHIKSLPSNRAMRYVYMRTLPLAQQAELEGKVENIALSIESSLESVIAKHATAELDTRGSVHLHSAGLAIATHHVLAPKLGTYRAVEIIRSAFGIGRSLPAHAITKAALMFSTNRMNAVKKMADNAISDFGSEFDANVQVDEDNQTCRMVVKKCYYKTLFDEEDVPHLTSIFCELDKALFQPISARLHGIDFKLTDTLAKGGEQCNFQFTKVSKK